MIRSFTSGTIAAPLSVQHQRQKEWVAQIVTLTQPDRIYWADGSQGEYDSTCVEMVASGMLTRLNPSVRKGRSAVRPGVN